MSAAVAETGNVAGELAIGHLVADHWGNPRGPVDTSSPAFAELKASIAEQGILEPIVVGPPLLELDGRHAIVAGWRRYTAATALGRSTVPIHQRIDITNAHQALRAALAENMAREQMTPLAEATAIARLVELGDTQVQAAAYVGVSERTARERLRLLDLPKPVKDAIDAGHVPTTCTRQLQLIADVAPAAATAIAKRMAAGKVKALDVVDPERLNTLLRDTEKQSGLVELRYGVDFKTLGLPPSTTKALQARLKAALPSWQASTYLEFTTGTIGKKIIEEARQAGKLLVRDDVAGTSDKVYLTGADWLERAATAVVEKAERRHARDVAARKAAPAQKPPASDPAQTERDAIAAAIDERAKPYAAAMNAELGARLRDLQTVTIAGPVARFVLGLIDGHHYIDQVAGYGFKYVDPGRVLDREWAQREPEEAAAQLVAGFVAAAFCDERALGDTRGSCLVRDLPVAVLHDVAGVLELLPDRAVRLAAARARLVEQFKYHDGRHARRRILLELGKTRGAIEVGALRERAAVYTYDSGQVDVGDCVRGPRFDAALAELLEDEHVVKVEGETKDGPTTSYKATSKGRPALRAAPAPAPVIEDIDSDDEPPAIDDPQEANDLMAKLSPGSRRTKLLELIGAHPGSTIPELAERMAIKQNYLYRLLPELADDGLVRKDGRGWHPAAADVAAAS